MCKKSTFLTIIIFLVFLQFTCIPNANAMFATVLKTNKARYPVLNRARPSSFSVRWHSTNIFMEASKILNAFGQSDRETVKLFLSSQSFVNSINVLEKNMESYEGAINQLQSKLDDFTLTKIRNPLSISPNIGDSNQQTDSKPDEVNQEELEKNCKSFSDNYIFLNDSVSKFINNTSIFINNSALQNATKTFESLRSDAQKINEKFLDFNHLFVTEKERRDYLYLKRQNASTAYSFFSEELQRLTEETKKLSNKCNEKINILSFVVANSGNIIDEDNRKSIKNEIHILEPYKEKLQRFEASNKNNEIRAQSLERRLDGCKDHVAELEEYIKRFSSNNNVNDVNQHIEDKINIINKSILEVKGEIENLKPFPSVEAGKIETLLAKHTRIKSIFQDMTEMTDLHQILNANLTRTTEEKIECIRKETDDIKKENLKIIEWSKTLEENLKECKKIIVGVNNFITEEENLIKKIINDLTNSELKNISKHIQELNKELEPLKTYFATLQVKAHMALSNHPNATENDFYNIAGVRTIRILSIDGGGVRGIIPSMILEKIEEETKRPIARQFDVMVGTSVGGLLTLALNVPNGKPEDNEGLKNKASELVKRAKDDAQSIFPRKYFSFWDPVLINYITSKLWTFFGRQSAYLEGKKGVYSTQGLEEVCRYYLEGALLKAAVSEVLIPVTEEKNGKINLKIFNKKSKDNDNTDLSMQIAALRTSRAPLYFATKAVEQDLTKPDQKDKKNRVSYADGGIILNNPAWKIYHRISNPNKKLRFIIVSLGTGQQKLTEKDKKDAARKTIETILQSASNAADKNLEEAFSEDKMLGKYIRINFSIDKVALNDSSTTTLEALAKKTTNYISPEGKENEGKEKIAVIVSLLKQKRPGISKDQLIDEEWFKD